MTIWTRNHALSDCGCQDRFRERKLPRPLQFAQQRNRKLRAVDLPPKRHGERAGAGAKLV